jgi:hypothetical protein
MRTTSTNAHSWSRSGKMVVLSLRRDCSFRNACMYCTYHLMYYTKCDNQSGKMATHRCILTVVSRRFVLYIHTSSLYFTFLFSTYLFIRSIMQTLTISGKWQYCCRVMAVTKSYCIVRTFTLLHITCTLTLTITVKNWQRCCCIANFVSSNCIVICIVRTYTFVYIFKSDLSISNHLRDQNSVAV